MHSIYFPSLKKGKKNRCKLHVFYILFTSIKSFKLLSYLFKKQVLYIQILREQWYNLFVYSPSLISFKSWTLCYSFQNKKWHFYWVFVRFYLALNLGNSGFFLRDLIELSNFGITPQTRSGGSSLSPRSANKN